MARFVVDLGGIEMSEKAEAQLADDIQRAVLSQIAKADIKIPVAIKFPREWYGIILRPDFDGLPGLEKEIGRFIGG
jgi:hypothetical protein